VDQQIVILIVTFVLMGALIYWQQRQARRRRERQIADLTLGDKVVTIGGIIGKLTLIDTETNHARIEIAPGVEMQILLSAINRTLPS
jgi:preprotein translocase subunit YajC